MVLVYILIATFVISLISLIGVFTLLLKENILNKALLYLVAFSAGGLLGGAFFHLLPEAILELGVGEGELLKIFLWLTAGFSLFLILEQFIHWHHHHKTSCESCQKIKPFSYLILISDGLHNFIDGLTLAVAFVISFPLGLASSLAVIFHEIPQEIGDFGVLVYGGMKKSRALFFNFLSALIAVLGGIAGYFLSVQIGGLAVFFLPFAAGNFIYIASSDLIPEIKNKDSLKESLVSFSVFLLGIFLMLALKLLSE